MGRVKELLLIDSVVMGYSNGSQYVSERPASKKSSNALKVQTAHSSPLFDNQLLDYKQAAQYLQISEARLRKLKAKKKIPFVAITLRSIRFKIAPLNSWVAEESSKSEKNR